MMHLEDEACFYFEALLNLVSCALFLGACASCASITVPNRGGRQQHTKEQHLQQFDTSPTPLLSVPPDLDSTFPLQFMSRGEGTASSESSALTMTMYCKSLYPFSGEQHQQGLSFDAGDVIKVVQELPGGWWEGEKDGARGWFPSSYVQVLEVRLHSSNQGWTKFGVANEHVCLNYGGRKVTATL